MPAQAIKIGHVEAHEKLTARVFIQPTGDNGYIDLGNVLDYKNAPERQFRTRMRAENGVRIVSDEEVDTIHEKYEFTLDEHDQYNARLLHLATKNVDRTDSLVAAPSGTATLTDVIIGRSYFLGRTALVTVVVKKSSTTLTLGTDYSIDLNTGKLTVLGGTLADGDDLDVTYGAAERKFQSYTGTDDFRFEGTVRIEEFNQHSKEPLRVITFTGVLIATGYPEQTGEFGKYTIRATPLATPTITKRYSLK